MNYNKVIKLIHDTLPHSIDVTPDGEFVIDDSTHGEAKYFENAEANLKISVECNGNIWLAYYSDDDEWYHLDILVTEETTAQELVVAFSEEFGWIENFELS